MGFLNNAKRAANLSKLKYDLVLMDREIESLKKQLGSDLFRVMFENDTDNDQAIPQDGKLMYIYVACKDIISDYVAKRQAKQEELDHVEMKREEGMNGVGDWFSNTGTLTKLKTEIAYYDREIRVRKEIFGSQVFEELNLLASAQEDKDESENDDSDADPVLAVLNQFVDNLRNVLRRKEAKQLEIEDL